MSIKDNIIYIIISIIFLPFAIIRGLMLTVGVLIDILWIKLMKLTIPYIDDVSIMKRWLEIIRTTSGHED